MNNNKDDLYHASSSVKWNIYKCNEYNKIYLFMSIELGRK